MPGFTLREAAKRCNFPVAKMILETSAETEQFFQFIKFQGVYGNGPTETYLRRKGKVLGKWRAPGETINDSDNPQMSAVTVTLREMVNQSNVRAYVTAHMSNAFDEREINRDALVKDMARDVAKAAIVGQYADTCSLKAGGGLTSTLLGTVIQPGPLFDPAFRGDGSLQFENGSGKLYFRAPGDNDFGEGVIIANGQTVTLRSSNSAFWITFTVGTKPTQDGHCDLVFSSSTNQPDGLASLIDPDQVIVCKGANGDNASFKILNALLSKLKNFNTPGEVAFVMHPTQFNALLERSIGLGGAKIEDKPFGDITAPAYRGVYPILQSDNIPDVVRGGNTSTHSIYAVNMNPDRGFFGLARGGETGSGEGLNPAMGFMIQDLGMNQTANASLERIVWNGAFGIRSPLAAAEFRGAYDDIV